RASDPKRIKITRAVKTKSLLFGGKRNKFTSSEQSEASGEGGGECPTPDPSARQVGTQGDNAKTLPGRPFNLHRPDSGVTIYI
ncbi:MAG: hypothetical protein HW384_1922, partial [Dehalococcoidia bacterium]|nr:hypothetical protein [Dehalococcoidia bacterium]